METVIGILARFQKALGTPTVHVIIPRLLLALLVAETRRRIEDPVQLNRELHKYGVWVGSRCMATIAKRKDLEKVHPKDQNPKGTAFGMSVYSKIAWYIFAGHFPRVETEIIKLDRGHMIKAVLTPDPNKDHIFKGVVSVRGVDTMYLASGAYEAATTFAFKVLEIEKLWVALWRPLQDREGLVGYYIWHEAPFDQAVEKIKSGYPGFFNTVSLEDSSSFLKEYLGVNTLELLIQSTLKASGQES